MSYNGSGVYTLPGAALANGDIVSATENNTFRNDVAAALNVAWTRDGQAPATANIPMGSHKLTGLAAGTGVGDSVRFEQLPSATNKLDLTTSVTGTLPVANGGSGAATLTGVLKGNGTSAFTAAVAGTDYLAPAAIGTTVQGYAAELQGATQGGINGMKNRIINGAMMIDQRNAGASVTPTVDGTYTVDRWKARLSVASKFSVQQSTTAPTGYKNSLLVTSLAATSVGASDFYCIQQTIEGYNIADLGFGAAGASSVTVSFWVRSSLTGTFGGSLTSNADNDSYPFTYIVNAANTWEQKYVTVAGNTAGTWLTSNGVGLNVYFGLGIGSGYSGTVGTWSGNTFKIGTSTGTSVVGTNGATFYITGVQLEKGSTATSFDYRPYGTELALCQRYFQVLTGGLSGISGSATGFTGVVAFPVCMRTAPASSLTAPYRISDVSTSSYTQSSADVSNNLVLADSGTFSFSNFTGMTTNRPAIAANSSSGNLLLSAEL